MSTSKPPVNKDNAKTANTPISYYIGHVIIIVSIVIVTVFLFEFMKTHKLIYIGAIVVVIAVAYGIIWLISRYQDNNGITDNSNSSKENFVIYKRDPFGYLDTGADPPNFYRRDSYRKPYRDGFKVQTSYPYAAYVPLDLGPQV